MSPGYSDLVVISSELYDKFASENAKGQVDRIKKSILSLDTFPQSHQAPNDNVNHLVLFSVYSEV